jgi:hypothetical protein
VHGGTHGHLDGLQIEAARLAAGVEDDAQQLVYFAGDFLLDRFGRFFSWASSSCSSTGRKRQTDRLTSTSLLVKDRNRRNSAISASALRTAAEEARFWEAVLPPIFWVS